MLGYAVVTKKKVTQECDALFCGRQAKWREAWDDDLPFPTNYWCDEHKPTITRIE